MSDAGQVFAAGAWSVRRLDDADEGRIQAFAERCSDYTQVVEGRPTGPRAGREFLEAAPAGWSPRAVLKLGVFAADGDLMGLLEAAPDYPAAGDWYLGLMLLDPQVRGAGRGARLYRNLERWVASRGGRRVVLSVVEDNAAAHRFWQRAGFADSRTLPAEQMGDKYQARIEMERRLPPDAVARPPAGSRPGDGAYR